MKHLSLKKRITKGFIPQQDQSDCGIACLASIINFHGGEYSLERLREFSGTSKQGTTLLGLCQASAQIGLTPQAMEAEGVDNLKELSEPAILHVLIESRLQHYIIFYGFENGNIVISDPAKGILHLTPEELNSIWKSKALLILKPNEKFIEKKLSSDKRKQWAINIIKEDVNLLAVSIFIGVVMALLSLSTAIFSQKLIDDILPSNNTQKLILSVLLLSVLLFTRTGLTFLRGFFLIRQAKDFNNRIIASFYNNLLRLPKPFFDTRKTGDMIARMNDTRRIQTVISSLSGSIAIDLLALIVSLSFLFAYSWLIGLVMLLSIPVYGVLAWYFNSPIVKAQREVMGKYAYSESNYVDTMQGIGTIKSSNHERFFEKVNKNIYGLFQDKVSILGQISLRFAWWSEFMGVFFTITTFAIASLLVFDKRLQLGELVAVLSMAGGIIPALVRLAVANIQIQEARIAFDRMYEFTSIRPEYSEESDLEKIHEINEVRVNHVSFRFNGRKQLLKDISLKVSKGETIALLGESGIGKSTLIQLLQKFYQPEKGSITIDQNDLQNIYTPAWREQIGVVPQEVKIFNGTLLYNIVLSESQEDIQQAILFCNSSGLSRFFEGMPQGYMTIIGEDGINLSGGQKQLVALARVLWRKPKLLLLDEATSGMDRNTEKIVMNLIKENKANMATVLVTHKIKTASNADRIYILEDGVISLGGTPTELLKTVNFYSESLSEDVLR
jgi:ATP-binding cassette, subfamily C, bacteriocin exporter